MFRRLSLSICHIHPISFYNVHFCTIRVHGTNLITFKLSSLDLFARLNIHSQIFFMFFSTFASSLFLSSLTPPFHCRLLELRLNDTPTVQAPTDLKLTLQTYAYHPLWRWFDASDVLLSLYLIGPQRDRWRSSITAPFSSLPFCSG